MSDKFEAAVEALSGVVELAAKPTIRKVRTPEGQKKYGQPIGSVIITDPTGKILETLYKGSGILSDSPSTSSFANNPKVAKHGATLPGQGAFANKAQQATYSSASVPTGVKKVDSVDVSKISAGTTPSQKAQSDALQEAQDKADAANNTKASAAEIDRAKNSVLKQQKTESSFYGGVSGGAADSTRALVGAFLEAVKSDKDIYAQTGAQGWFWSGDKPVNGYVVSPTGEIHAYKAGQGKGDPVKFNASADSNSWTALLDKYTKKSAGPEAAAKAKDKADSYIETNLAAAGVQGSVAKQTIDTPKGPMEIHVTPDAEIFTTGTGAIVRHKSGAFPDGYVVKYNAKGGPTLNAKMVASAKKVGAPDPSHKDQSDALQEAQDTPAVVPKTKVSAGAVSKILSAAKETKGEKHAGMVKGMPVVYTGFTVKQNKDKFGNNTDVRVSYQFQSHWENHSGGVTEAEYSLTKMQKYKSLLEGAGYSVSLHESSNGFKPAYLTVDVGTKKADAPETSAKKTDAPALESDAPSLTEPKAQTAPAAWKVNIEGTLQNLPIKKGDKVWAWGSGSADGNGSLGFYVERPDGTAASYRIENLVLKKSNLTASQWAKKKDDKTGKLTPVDEVDTSWKSVQAKPLDDSDAKPIKALVSATKIPEDDFLKATVVTPKGKQKVYVSPGAKVFLTGTGAAVAYPTGKTVKYNTVSGKATMLNDPNPPHFAEVSIDGLDASGVQSESTELDDLIAKLKAAAASAESPSAPKDDAPEPSPAQQTASAMEGVGDAASSATKALKNLQSAIADINAGKSVKGTKYGDDSNGAKGWQFTTHTSASGAVVYSDSDQWGNTYLYEVGTSEPISGPFAQVKEAKAWLAENGKEQAAPALSTTLPEKHDVPSTAGKKVKPSAPSSNLAKKSAAPEAKTGAQPPKKKAAESPSSGDENFFTPNPLGKTANVNHPKYGDMSVDYKDGDKVYTTGVGVVVKSSDGSGLVKSGKTGKVEKFDSLPDNKLPKSSTVEVKKKDSQTPAEAAASALEKALDTKSQKDIDAALEADQKAADPSYTPEELKEMPNWEKELLGLPLTPTGLDYVDVPEAEPLHETLAKGKIPLWAKPSLVEAKTVLHVTNSEDQSWLVFELPNGARRGIAPVFASGSVPGVVEGAVWDELVAQPKTTVLKGSLDEPKPVTSAIPDEIFGDSDGPSVLHEAIAAGSLPSWMKPMFDADGVDRVWLIPVADDSGNYSAAARSKDGSFKLYFSDSDGSDADTIITLPDSDKKMVLKNGQLLWDEADGLGFAFPKSTAKKPEDAPEYAPFVDASSVGDALEKFSVPSWLKTDVQSADDAWRVKTASGYSLILKNDDKYEIYYPFDTAPAHVIGGTPVSAAGAESVIAKESTQKINIEPAVSVSPTAPDLPADSSADAPSVNADNAVKKEVAGDWIKGKKVDGGYELVGVTDESGNPVFAKKVESYWGTEWKTPWGLHGTLKKAKAAAAQSGVIDYDKVKSPAEIKAAAAKKAKKTPGVPAGSTLNDLGVPEVEWNGHRLPLFPGMRMFEYNGNLYIFDGKDSVRVTPEGVRSSGQYTQKEIKDAGGTQVAFGGTSTLGKYDFSSLKDASSDKEYDFSIYKQAKQLNDLFQAGDLSGMAHFAEYLEGPDIPVYMSKNLKKYVKSVEVAAHILQLEKSAEDGNYDGSLFAKIDAAGVPLPPDVGVRLNALRKDFALRSAKALGYDLGDSADAPDVEQTKALALSRGFALAPYMSSNDDARRWLLTEFTYAGFSQPAARTGLLSTLKHQKVLSKFAVDSKYEKYLTQPTSASKVEKVAVQGGSVEDKKAALDAVLADAGTSIHSAIADTPLGQHVYKTGNIVAAAALSGDFEAAFDSLPEATKKAFYTRMHAHGVDAVVKADFEGFGSPSTTGVRANYTKFVENAPSADLLYTPHLATMQEKFSDENLASLKVKDAAKPENIPATSWALVLSALDKGEAVEEGLLPEASQYDGPDLHFKLGVSEPLVADAPPVVKQLLAYGSQAGPHQESHIQFALKAIAQTGVWGKPWADSYQVPDGPMLYLRPGDKVYVDYNKTTVYNEFFPQSSYGVTSGWNSGTFIFSPLTPYSIPSKDAVPAKSVPVNWDYGMAKSFVPHMDEKTFDSLMGALKGSYEEAVEKFPVGQTLKGESIVAVKNFFDTPDFSSQHPTLKSMGVSGVPDGALAALHHANINDDPTVPQMLEVLANYGYFTPKEKTNAEIWADQLGLDPAKSYFQHLSSVTSEASLLDALTGYGPQPVKELAEDLTGKKFDDLAGALSHYDAATTYALTKKMWDQLQGELGKVEKPKADLDELTLSPTNKKLGGMHSKKVWVDQHGNEWMSKAFPSDPNGNYRVDVEHAANEIARLYGYNAPATRVMELEGKHQYVQLLAPASGELGHQSWSSMPESVVIDAMSEHVIDWVVSNHDSHHGNILKTPDGQHAFGIDKGQAGRFFGKDKLAEGYHASNPEPAWYDNVYSAIRTGQMSKEQADVIRDAVLRKAAQVSTRNGERFKELMHESQKNRVDFPAQFPNAQAWVDAHEARRQSTFDDFVSLYKGLYEKAGYDWGGKNSIDDYLPKKVADKFHVAPSEELAEAVQKYGTLGTPLFYKTGVFADDSMLVYKTKGADGSDTLRANVTLLSDADQTFTTWLKSHTIEKINVTSSSYIEDSQDNHAKMPHLDETYPALVAYAKTVNTHAADGNYTQSTVNNGTAAKEKLQTVYDKVKEFADGNPTDLFTGDGATFYTHEQQDTWLAHANRMLQQFAVVDEAKAKGVKVSEITDDTPFQMPAYKPSEGLDTSGKPKVTIAYKHNGLVQQKWSDGNYTSVTSQGVVAKSTKGDFAVALKDGEISDFFKDAPAEVDAPDAPDEPVESVVSVANVPVKVSYQPASSFAKASSNGFDVTEGTGKVNFTGHEYQIQVGDITIKYQGLDDNTVARAQRGLARIEIGDWDGNPDAMEKVNELFESIGLDIGDATEQTMEIGYYRRLAAVANRRKLSAKYKALVEKKIAKTGDQAEIDAYRKLLEGVYGKSTMQEFYDSKGWLPYMPEAQHGGVAGPAHWLRPDSSVEDYKTWTNGRLPVHSMTNPAHAESIASTGLFSTEDRMRILGEWIGGMSSGADQNTYGSSEYVYWRQNQSAVPSYGVVLEPEFAVAGSNYAAGGDTYGSTDTKVSNAHFDLKGQASHTGGGNELMVKKGVTLFDGIAVITVGDEAVRAKILKRYADLGIENIRGIPVAERIVVGNSAAQKTISKVWDLAIEAEKKRKGKVA